MNIYNNEFTLIIAGISDINSSAGEEDYIDISLFCGNGLIATVCVKLIVSYLEFYKDRGVVNGVEDNIEYECHQIIDAFYKSKIKSGRGVKTCELSSNYRLVISRVINSCVFACDSKCLQL